MESPQAKSSPEAIRLLPLVEGAPNEGVANTLARLLIDDESQAEIGASSAIVILSGIQAFYDSGGDFLVVERIWEPYIVARQMQKAFGANAWKKAAEMAGAAHAANDERGAVIYERVATLLSPDVNKQVDSPA
jgi:hypothetical protein